MRLLVCAQAIDRDDKELSFFLLWLEELAKHFESIVVLCLREGAHDLPANVRVIPLGRSRLVRAGSLLRHAVAQRGQYDAVFVHQGQEFVLVSGWLWRSMGKPVYLWRNHYAGSLLTDIAAGFCTKIFCTSAHSYTAKFKKTTLMPVGIDTGTFSPMPGVERKPRSVLFLARMAPSKRAGMLIDALKLLKKDGAEFSATIVGSPLPKDAAYYGSLVESAQELRDSVRFMPGVPNAATPALYSAHAVFVNCSRSGMYDKTIFEAAACGCLALAASDDWRALAGEPYYFEDAAGLSRKLEEHFHTPSADLRPLAQKHSLEALTRALYTAIV